jgi:hypothetical protein
MGEIAGLTGIRLLDDATRSAEILALERPVAYHESGHTVIAHRLGMHPSLVTITDLLGNGVFTEGNAAWAARRCTAEQRILSAMAGPLAEIISKGAPLTFSGENLDVLTANMPDQAALCETLVGKSFVDMTNVDAVLIWGLDAFAWGGDMETISRKLAEDGSLDKDALYRRAFDMVIADWPRIQLMAETLMRLRPIDRKLDRKSISWIMRIPESLAVALSDTPKPMLAGPA